MTYMEFHYLFTLPPVILFLLLIFYFYKNEFRFFLLGISFLSVLALVYTTPWDNYLVKSGVWSYGEGTVLAVIGYVPIEEYLFFFLQTFLTGSLLFYCMHLFGDWSLGKKQTKSFLYQVILSIYVSIFVFSVLGFFYGTSYRYLSLILSWGMPIVIGQWLYGGETLLRLRKTLIMVLGASTLYLWVIDRLAIVNFKIWQIPSDYSLELFLFGLPIEEAVFFLVTNIMVVQGLVLFWLELNHRLDTRDNITFKKLRMTKS